jgi:putative two-component system response regulator
LTSERPYKKAWTVEAAMAHIQEQAGKHFDPELVALFVSRLDEILEIKRKWAD